MEDKHYSLRDKLDYASEQVTEEEQAALHSCRQQVLRDYSQGQNKSRLTWWLPAGAVFTSIAGAIVFWLAMGGGLTFQPNEQEMNMFLSDVEILNSQDDLQLFEDLEMYKWLLEEVEKES